MLCNYAGIMHMLDAFAILLCSKSCWHNWLKRKLNDDNMDIDIVYFDIQKP